MDKKDLSFSKLVRDLDKRWSHTYEDPPQEEEAPVWELLLTLPLNDKAGNKED